MRCLFMLRNNRKELGMVKGYDSWLLRQADEYMEYLCCEPKIIGEEKQYEPDGYSVDKIYNCEGCCNDECEYWSKYNG